MTTTAEPTTTDQAKAEAFAGQMLGIINNGVLMSMVSIGHRTGLWDKLATLPPSTSEEIAKATGLNERYVREWLGATTTGRITEYDPATRRYQLPPEHAGFLTRAAGPNNLATYAFAFSQLVVVEDAVVEAFKNGGGVPYSRYPTFQGLMAQLSGQVHDAALIDVIIPLLGDEIVAKLRSGAEVADVGCGQGHAINLMAKAFPNSRFTGYDFSEQGIAAGRAEAKQWGLTNASHILQDAATLAERDRFDVITVFDAIHDQAKPATVLKNIFNALKPGGMFLMCDVEASSNVEENMDHPMGPGLYSVSVLHCMTVSLALNGDGLGTMWGRQKALEMLAEAGFSDVRIENIEGDLENAYYICRKP
ncbi:MAG TPA: class I SAM-dependent methyltransferase [Dehalococcoidia bacterium]|nr:class I SAM-dependent methyltransferase [Dehalococcoidia bacterium]